MSVGLLLARLVLACLFAVAGVTKLRGRQAFSFAVADMGVPGRLIDPVAVAVIAAELSVAVLLLPAATAAVAGVAAAFLLICFSCVIGLNVARGRQPDCHCFGELHSLRVGPPALLRNAALFVLALFVVVGGLSGRSPSLADWARTGASGSTAGDLSVSLVVALAVACLAWTLSRRDTSAEAEAVAGSAPLMSEWLSGDLVEGYVHDRRSSGSDLEMLDGTTTSMDLLMDGCSELVLLFVSGTCSACTALLPDIRAAQQRDGERRVAVVTDRTSFAPTADFHTLRADHVIVDNTGSFTSAWGVEGTPTAIRIDESGNLIDLAEGPDRVRALLGQSAGVEEQHAPAVGDAAPDFALRGADGLVVTKAALSGTEVVLLFWNPGCGHCLDLLHDLVQSRTSEAAKPPMLVISRGRLAPDDALSAVGRLALDEAGLVARQYGVPGTPAALLLGPDGVVSAPLALGRDAILGLLQQARVPVPPPLDPL